MPWKKWSMKSAPPKRCQRDRRQTRPHLQEQPRRRGDDIRRHLRGAADDQRVGLGEIGFQLFGGAARAGIDRPSFGAEEVQGGGGKIVSDYDVHVIKSPGSVSQI